MATGDYDRGQEAFTGTGPSQAQPGLLRIFINYRREDAAGHAGHLYETLATEFGDENIFMDVEKMEPGADFVEVIQDQVGRCRVLLAIIGRNWLTTTDDRGQRRIDDPNDFVRLEIEAALRRNVRVIPVLVDGVRVPQVDELPESLGDLSRRQALEISPGRWRYDVNRLITLLKKMQGGAQRPSGPAVPPSARPPLSGPPASAWSPPGPPASAWSPPGPPDRPSKKTPLIRAVVLGGALVGALLVVGLLAGRGDTPMPLPPPPAFPTPAEQAVLDHIPAFVKGGNQCHRPPEQLFEGTVGVNCDPNERIRVSYYQFRTAEEMNRTYDALVADKQLLPASCDPAINPAFAGDSTWGGPEGPQIFGRAACYLSSDGYPWIEWTEESLRIYTYAFAVGNPDTEAAKRELYEVWKSAGPFG